MEQDSLSLQFYRNSEAVYLALEGRLTRTTSEEMKRAIAPLLELPQKRFFISLHELRSIDSAGLGLLVEMNTRLRKKGKEVFVLQPNVDVGRLLHLAKMELLMQIEAGIAADRVRREMEREELAFDPSEQSAG